MLIHPHGKFDLPCPRWLPPGLPHHRTSGHRRVAGHGCNGAYEMSGADLVGNNRTVGANGKDGRVRMPMARTGMGAQMAVPYMGMWARMFKAGIGMWAWTLWRV